MLKENGLYLLLGIAIGVVKRFYNADGTPICTFATFRLNPDKDLPPGSGLIRGYDMPWANQKNNSNDPTTK